MTAEDRRASWPGFTARAVTLTCLTVLGLRVSVHVQERDVRVGKILQAAGPAVTNSYVTRHKKV
jgi:hypothetical protein